jgi:hypothetical protein
MPTSASALAGTLENRRATSAPSPATIERDGEKIPPGMPLSRQNRRDEFQRHEEP